MGRLRALLVGIDDYPAPVPPLVGCVADVTSFAETLQGRIPVGDLDVKILTDAAATRAAVTSALTEHLGASGPDDIALLYFSGHGSQQKVPPDLWPTEPDRRNETIVLVDSRTPGQYDLADKELAVLLGSISATGCHLLAVLDCCHSGDGTRDARGSVRLRLAPEDPRERPSDSYLPAARSLAPAAGAMTRSAWSSTGTHILLAACRSSETAKEIQVRGGSSRGALSVSLEQALRDSGGQPTYRDILRFVTAGVLQRVEDQHPQLETTDATDLDRPFLGGAVPPRPRQLTLTYLPDGWTIDAGAVHGVPEQIGDDTTELAIYALAGATDGVPLATAKVTRVLPDRSLVDVEPALATGSIYRAVITSIPLSPMAIGVTGDDAGAAALRAAATDADQTLIELVAPGTHADLVVNATATGFEITRPGVTRPLVPVVEGDHREERTVVALERVARWLRLADLHNPATHLPPGALSLTVTTDAGSVDDDGRVQVSYAAELAPPFTVTIANTTSTPLWCALLDLTETYGIFTDAFPAGSVALAPGESVPVPLSGQLSDAMWAAGTVSVTDQLKVVTSTLEFDPRSLEQPELDVSAVGGQAVGATAVRGDVAPKSTLERLLRRVTTRSSEAPKSPDEGVADWRTDDLFVITTRPQDT